MFTASRAHPWPHLSDNVKPLKAQDAIPLCIIIYNATHIMVPSLNKKTCIRIVAIFLCASFAWRDRSSMEPDVTIQITPAPKFSGFPESGLFRPSLGWVVRLTNSDLSLGATSLIISSGIDHDITLRLSGNYETYLEFPQKLKSIGLRAKNITSGRFILVNWRTLQGSGSSKLSEINEIEIPLEQSSG